MIANINNIGLNYTKQGSGSPLILLHGNGEDHHIFDKLVDKLKNQFTVYAIDSRNHGESSKTDDYSYTTMGEDILQFIGELDLKKPSIIGFSDGAIIASILASQNFNLFGKIVWLGINLKPCDFKEENIEYLTQEYNKTKDPLLKLMLEQPNIELASLKNITTPTLVVGAENDLFRDDLFEDIVNVMPNAELLIMKDHEHDSYVVNQDILYPYLMEFLSK